MTDMQFAGKLTKADLNDVRKLTRSKLYWPKLVLANWYGTAVILIVLWATISGAVGQTKPNWRAVSIIWAVVVGIVLWAYYSTKRKEERELAELNAALPDRIRLTTEGLKSECPSGATGFMPWTNLKGLREGQRVILLDQLQGKLFVMLPVAQLSEIERLSVRQNLQSHISPIR